jgi:hypothetical protein
MVENTEVFSEEQVTPPGGAGDPCYPSGGEPRTD